MWHACGEVVQYCQRQLHAVWCWIKECTVADWLLGAVFMALCWWTDHWVAILMMAMVFPRFNESVRGFKQWNILLGFGYIGLSAFLWYYARGVSIAILLGACLMMARMAMGFYRQRRVSNGPGESVGLAVWDAFGEWGSELAWPLKVYLSSRVAVTLMAKADPVLSKGKYAGSLKPRLLGSNHLEALSDAVETQRASGDRD